MDLEKKYKDSNGDECNILQMIKREPEWAANMLQRNEEAITALEKIWKWAASKSNQRDKDEAIYQIARRALYR